MHDKIPRRGREIIVLLAELSRALRCCQQEAVFCENVTFTQFLILDLVAEKGKLRLSDLHNILSVEKSTTTRLVNPLVKQALILRQKSEKDSRAINLTLTKNGIKVHQRVWDCLSGFFNSIESRIPDQKRPEVYESVKLFLNALKNASTEDQCGT